MNEETKERPVDALGNPIYSVPEGNLDELRVRIEKLNKRARKLNLAGIAVTEVGEEFVTKVEEVQDAFGRNTGQTIELKFRFVKVTVVGETPRENGWDFAATVQHDEGGNILAVSPKFSLSLPVQYRTAETLCEHCHTNRRRNDTYVLYHSETGAWKQVGRNCLADFLRTTNPEAIATYAELLQALNDDLERGFGGGGLGGGKQYFGTHALLSQVAALIRVDGWCSRTEARADYEGRKQATVDAALRFFDATAKLAPEYREARVVTGQDKENAAAAIAWAQALEPAEGNDYLWNIHVASNREQVDYRAAGLVGSIVSAYNRELERELAKKYERENSLNEHFGTVGQREVFTLTVRGIRSIEGKFGPVTIYKFRDGEGRTAVWFASADQGWELDQTVVVTATVKDHTSYKEWAQTNLTRVALYVEKPAKAPRKRKVAAPVAEAVLA